jgi:hypothetical protein
MLARLGALFRCEARGLPMPSPVKPPKLPISVDVRSMLWMAGLRVSGLPGALPSPGALPVPRDMADSWELRLWRPLGGPLGSLSWSMAPLQT